MNRHSKYLHPQLVVMALGSDKVTPGEKKANAEALLAVKEDFNVKKVNKDYTNFHVLDVWPEGKVSRGLLLPHLSTKAAG